MLAGAVTHAQRLSSHHFTFGRAQSDHGHPAGSGGTALMEAAEQNRVEAARELLDLYYMYVDQVEADIMDEARFGKDPSHLLEHINRMRTLMGLGWMRRMLRAAADEARERGYRRIDIEQIVNIDPFAEG